MWKLAQRSNGNLRRNKAVTNGGEGINDDEWRGTEAIGNRGDDEENWGGLAARV